MTTTATTTRTRKTRTPTTKSKAVFAFLVLLGASAFAQGDRNSKKPAHFAVIAGTVFRDPGFAQPGSTVSVARKDQPAKKLGETESNYRGEFTFHVPAGPAAYIVAAKLKGFQEARQEFEVSGDEQINATLLLIPESKK